MLLTKEVRQWHADHGSNIRPCVHRIEVEDQDDPMKADWGL